MDIFKKSYSVVENPPKEISWEDYYIKSMEEYENLLETKGNEESAFQVFFEENPAFLPGGLELFGQSGHYPYMHALISQPTIGTHRIRIPDFMWLAQDSLSFCPVFIEIEAPNKNMFTQKNIPSSEFSQAMNQIDEWKALLSNPVKQMDFMDRYDIPQNIREKTFNPQYLLVFGRRKEYEDNENLLNLRKQKEKTNVAIFSFDRLKPLADYKQFITCKVKDKKYNVISISPTFRYRADCAEELYKWKGFLDRIETMKMTSDERKDFLRQRYSYWCDFKGKISGLITSMEGE